MKSIGNIHGNQLWCAKISFTELKGIEIVKLKCLNEQQSALTCVVLLSTRILPVVMNIRAGGMTKMAAFDWVTYLTHM